MTTYRVVVPVLDEEIGVRCVESLWDPNNSAGFTADEILVVDNTRYGFGYADREYRDWMPRVHRETHNLGVARSWNVGAREVMALDLDYLVICSASMLFGPILHTTFREQIERFPDAHHVEAEGHSWHLIAIHRRVFEAVGLFDENFYPAYFEQIDFSRRVELANLGDSTGAGWANVWVNALSTGVGQHHPMLDCPAPPLLDYYRDKWGGDKGFEQFHQPWGYRPLDYFPQNTIPQLAERYGLETWW